MRLLSTLMILTVLPLLTLAQTKLVADHSYGSIKIAGTSSLHEWEELVTEYGINGVTNGKTIQNLEMKVTVKSIESGKSIMDDKTHEALKASKHPYINLKSKELRMNNGKIEGTGTIHLAGVSKEIQLKADYSLTDNSIIVKGMTALKMTDFGIEPPTAMFGTLTTGDEVTVIYDLKLKF